jgi:CheY-like chemotaxis protein
MESKKILIVDDDIDLINVVSTILSHEGFEVHSANDKKAGLAKAREIHPDLAILDVMMTTHYEGFELAKEISEDPILSQIPVLMQTSIEVLTTSKSSVRDMAREFREHADYRDLQVILLKDSITGEAGVDYRAEDGRSVWLPVGGFIHKPVDARRLIPEVRRMLNLIMA